MVKFPPELTIKQVEDFKNQIIPELTQQVITLDDSELVQTDTIGVQFILALVTYVLSQNKEIQWHSQSSALQDSMKALGINENILLQYFD